MSLARSIVVLGYHSSRVAQRVRCRGRVEPSRTGDIGGKGLARALRSVTRAPACNTPALELEPSHDGPALVERVQRISTPEGSADSNCQHGDRTAVEPFNRETHAVTFLVLRQDIDERQVVVGRRRRQVSIGSQ